ncbi:MAG: carboxy terminal-processing peptidase, partial [Chitinophagaceae bacterium]|nr:carboxy terminal-processing peptidase [Chitinophagaceae bacterium]
PDALEYYKGREKDNPGALPYDEIPKLNYQTWSSDFGLESLAKKENERIQSNPSLNLLKSNLQWLAKNSELPVDLNLEKYRNRQQQVMSTVNQNNALLKAKQELNVSALAADKDKFYNNPDPSKGERYQAWLKFLKTDMHIDESVKIVSQMAHSQVQMVAK